MLPDRNYLPDSVVAAMIRGTSQFPQLNLAASVEVGDAICTAVSAGQTNWRGILAADVSPAQGNGMLGPAVNTMHQRYNIGPRFDPGGSYAVPKSGGLSRRTLSEHALGRCDTATWTSELFLRTLHRYERASALGRVASIVTMRRPYHKERSITARENVMRLDYEENHADAQLLSMMWRACASVLKRPEVVEDAHAYRDKIARLYKAGKPISSELAAGRKTVQLASQMKLSLLEARPGIKAATGRDLPRAALRAFVIGLRFNPQKHDPND